MRPSRSICAIAALTLAGVVACKKDNGVGPDIEGKPITTTLCGDGSGQTRGCTIPIAGKSSFTITVTSHDCLAHGNVVRVVAPVDSVLTSDACYLDAGATWTFNGPFPSAATLNLSVLSTGFRYPPELRASGSEPQWTIKFEDGADQDFNDIVMTVTTAP